MVKVGAGNALVWRSTNGDIQQRSAHGRHGKGGDEGPDQQDLMAGLTMIVDGVSAASWQTTSASQKKIILVRLVQQEQSERVRNMPIPQI